MLMNKYIDIKKYQRLKPYQEIGGIMRLANPEPCCVCCGMTEFADINYEAAFCGPECMKDFEKDIPRIEIVESR